MWRFASTSFLDFNKGTSLSDIVIWSEFGSHGSNPAGSLSLSTEMTLSSLFQVSIFADNSTERNSPKCRSSAMSTSLNYGFTTTRYVPERASAKSTAKPPSRIFPGDTILPPIPSTAPLSIPQLGDRRRETLSCRSRVDNADQCLTALDHDVRAPPNKSLPLPPIPSHTSPPTTIKTQSPDPALRLTATLFSTPKVPSRSLYRSSRSLSRGSKRVQNILRDRRIHQLNVPHGQSGSEAPSSRRNSISMTPISAYAGHAVNKPPTSLQTNIAKSSWDREMALTPIEMDLGALEVIASLPETARPTRKHTVVKIPLRKKSLFHPSSRSEVLAVELPGGSLLTVITPEQSAWQRAQYVPGSIRLESKAKTERSPLAIIQETVHTELGLDKERIAAEQAMVDELVNFIDSFGEEFCVHETGMDMFWVDRVAQRSSHVSARALSPSVSIAPALAQTEPIPRPPRLTRKDSSTAGIPLDLFGDLEECEFIRGASPAVLKRASFASSDYSGSSRTTFSTPIPTGVHSPGPSKCPYGTSPSSGLHIPMTSKPNRRKVRQVKGKGASSSNGQKISLRGLLRSAASIV